MSELSARTVKVSSLSLGAVGWCLRSVSPPPHQTYETLTRISWKMSHKCRTGLVGVIQLRMVLQDVSLLVPLEAVIHRLSPQVSGTAVKVDSMLRRRSIKIYGCIAPSAYSGFVSLGIL